MIEFFYKCIPSTTTAQAGNRIFFNRKTGRQFIGKDPKTKAVQKEYGLAFSKWKPKLPLSGPLKLEVEIIWPFKKATPKYVRARGKVHRDTKPDCDNIMKQISDALEWAGYFHVGDQQISELTCKKFHGEDSGIKVRLEELE